MAESVLIDSGLKNSFSERRGAWRCAHVKGVMNTFAQTLCLRILKSTGCYMTLGRCPFSIFCSRRSPPMYSSQLACRRHGSRPLSLYVSLSLFPFYRTISGVRLCWELEEPEGPIGLSFSPSLSFSLSPSLCRGLTHSILCTVHSTLRGEQADTPYRRALELAQDFCRVNFDPHRHLMDRARDLASFTANWRSFAQSRAEKEFFIDNLLVRIHKII